MGVLPGMKQSGSIGHAAVQPDVADLVEHASLVEHAELRALYQREFEQLVGLAHWMVGSRGLAEELVQDTFVRLVQRPPVLSNPEALSAYVRSAVLNGSRSKVRRLILERRYAKREAEQARSGEVAVLETDPDQSVRDAIARLPMRQRECVVLRFYADLTVDGIADTVGISAGSVKTHLHRAMVSLKKTLTDNHPDQPDGPKRPDQPVEVKP